MKNSRQKRQIELKRKTMEAEEQKKKEEALKLWIGVIGFLSLVESIWKLKDYGYDMQRHLFLFNWKARIIQHGLRKCMVR